MEECKYNLIDKTKLDEIFNIIEEKFGEKFTESELSIGTHILMTLSYHMGQVDALLKLKTPIPEIVKILGICEPLVQSMSEKM